MALFRLSPKTLAARWAEPEAIEALDAPRFDEFGEDEVRRRAKLLQKASVASFVARDFARACVLRARSHAISALKAAGMDRSSLEAVGEPDDVAAACDELLPRVRALAEEAGARAAQRHEEHRQKRPRPVVGPVDEQTPESLTGWAGSMLENLMSLYEPAPTADRAMLAGAAFQTLHLTHIAADIIQEPRAHRDPPSDEEIEQELIRRGLDVNPIEIETERYRQTESAKIGALSAAMQSVWSGEAANVRASGAALAAASAGVQATATSYFAAPPAAPMQQRATFTDFVQGGRSELQWQADWLRSHLEEWQRKGGASGRR